MSELRPHQSALLLAGAVTPVAWAVPVLGLALLPLQYLNTHLHELCHAIVGIGSGGDVHEILVFGDGGGVTPIYGGATVLEASAGYVGAAIGGALMILFSRHEVGARLTLRVLAGVLGLSLLLWVRGDAIGIITGIFWVAALAGLSLLKGRWLLFAAQFVGLQQCLSSVRSLYVLVQISAIGEGHSDAGLMQNATGVPAIVWSLVWCAISLGLLTVALRRAWQAPNHPAE